MEQMTVWFLKLCKRQCKKARTWIILLGMAAVTALVTGTVLPNQEETTVVICDGGSATGKLMMRNLDTSDSIFDFQSAADAKEVETLVLEGEADCGFVFPADMDDRMRRGDIRKCIVYVGSTYTTKGAVARETVFAQFFQCYSQNLLENSAADIFRDPREALPGLQEKNQEYLQGDDIFTIDFQTVKAEKMPDKEMRETFPLRGMLAAFLFLNMLLVRGEQTATAKGFVSCLRRPDRQVYEMLDCIAADLLPGLGMIGLLLVSGEGTGPLEEMWKILLYLIFCGIWVSIVGGLLQKTSYYGWVVTLLGMSLICSDTFWNPAAYLPAIKLFNWCHPVGFYLQMF